MRSRSTLAAAGVYGGVVGMTRLVLPRTYSLLVIAGLKISYSLGDVSAKIQATHRLQFMGQIV